MSVDKRMYAVRPRRWPWIVLAAALAIALAVVIATNMFSGDASNDQGTPTGQVDLDAEPEPAPGCLGGADPNTAILEAQKKAPLTAGGAAAFAGTAIRWLANPGTPKFDETAKAVMTPEARAEAGAMASGQSETVEADLGYYEVEGLTGDTAAVKLDWQMWDSSTGETAAAYGVVALKVVDGVWRFDGFPPRENADVSDAKGEAERARLASEGVEFVGACS